MKIDQDNAMGSALAKAKRTKDYSHFILKERMTVMKRRAELGSMEEGTMRLIKALPRKRFVLEIVHSDSRESEGTDRCCHRGREGFFGE